MRYYDKLIFELSKTGRIGHNLPKDDFENVTLPKELLRDEPAELPEVTELDVVRHYTNVSLKNFGVETGFYPLGSCTMKYNPKINDELATLPGFVNIHPLQPNHVSQGFLQVYYELATYLSKITGMDAYSLNTYAGAQGELAGLMIIKKYHHDRGDFKRNKIIVPDSAHGTNPASATVAGFDVVEVKSNLDGTINVESLKEALDDTVAGLMLTNPNTAGMFEKDILEVADLIHDQGGLLYYDGANLNALLGIARPGDMGFDITHLNLHKTFSTPHGGGGPGSGPVGVKSFLAPYLPEPVLKKDQNRYYWDNECPVSCGKLHSFYGNYGVMLKAYAYIRALGGKGLKETTENAVINANYMKTCLKEFYELPYEANSLHEFVLSGSRQKEQGASTLNIAKRLLDYEQYAPTIYFPLVVKEALMIEPTETENLSTLNRFVETMKIISRAIEESPELVKNAPHNTPVRKLDEAKAARKPDLRW